MFTYIYVVMKKSIINFCEFEEQDYELVAIHSVLRDYKMAYKMNDKLEFNLSRITPDLDLRINENDKASFSVFEFHETKSFIDWHLVKNKFLTESKDENLEGLFSTENLYQSSCICLQPELKEVDYLLKIEGDFDQQIIDETIKKIKEIEGVITCYSLEKEKLNHKEHLIF